MRRSTAIGGGGLYQLTCDGCSTGFNTLSAADWRDVERQANGWKFMGERDYCRRCAGIWGARG